MPDNQTATTFKSRFTKIEGLSNRRRLPRLGKIRLGVKVVSPKSGKEYPKETPHFVVPQEVEKIYGKEPKAIDVMLPINDIEVVFPQAYKHYGSSRGLKCIGNGRVAQRVNEDGSFEETECPCEKLDSNECSQRASLMVILPKVNLGGVYQIDVGSFNSIVDINSGIDYVKALMKEALGVERFAMIPLILKREPRETHHDNKKQMHYTLTLHANVTIDQLNAMKNDARILSPEPYALPAVEEINPKFDEGAVVVIDEEENGKQQQEQLAKEEKAKTASPAQQPAAQTQTQPPSEQLVDQEQLKALGQIIENKHVQPFEKYMLNIKIADDKLTLKKAATMIHWWSENLDKRVQLYDPKNLKAYYEYIGAVMQKLMTEYPNEYAEFIGAGDINEENKEEGTQDIYDNREEGMQ
jgi:hypothetical protein